MRGAPANSVRCRPPDRPLTQPLDPVIFSVTSPVASRSGYQPITGSAGYQPAVAPCRPHLEPVGNPAARNVRGGLGSPPRTGQWPGLPRATARLTLRLELLCGCEV